MRVDSHDKIDAAQLYTTTSKILAALFYMEMQTYGNLIGISVCVSIITFETRDKFSLYMFGMNIVPSKNCGHKSRPLLDSGP
jgi:hypothetical protein